MKVDTRSRLTLLSHLLVCLTLASLAGAEPPAQKPLSWDQSKSVVNRRIHPTEPSEKIDWNGRLTTLLREEPGDVVITAVGDMIFNEQISKLAAPERQGLFRIMQEADLAYGNLEFSMNDHPELQKPFYNFRTPPEFAFEVAAIGINLVSMANNHALDFGGQGLLDCLKALDRASIDHAGAGSTLAGAHTPASTKVQHQQTEFAMPSVRR